MQVIRRPLIYATENIQILLWKHFLHAMRISHLQLFVFDCKLIPGHGGVQEIDSECNHYLMQGEIWCTTRIYFLEVQSSKGVRYHCLTKVTK